MNVDDIIQLRKNNHHNPPLNEDPLLFDLLINDGISLMLYKEIFSTNFYPERIHFQDKDYLLWDNNYWTLYIYYLFGITKFHEKTPATYLADYYNALFFLFLACRFETYPAIAYVFSRYFNAMSDVFPNYQNQKPMQLLKSNTMDEFANIVFVSKWIVLEHEICHVNYSKDSKIKDEHINIVYRALRILSPILAACENSPIEIGSIDKIDPIKKSSVNASLFQLCDNPKFAEEITCDVIAFLKVLKAYAEFNNVSTQIAYTECLAAYMHLANFQGYLTQVETMYAQGVYHIKKIFDTADFEFIYNKSAIEKIEQARNAKNAEASFRMNVLPLIVILIYGGVDEESGYVKNNFWGSDAYKKFFHPMFNNVICNNLLFHSILLETVDIKHRATPTEFIKARDLLIGWY